MSSSAPMIIPLDKRKMWFSSIGCVFMIVVGFFFILSPWQLQNELVHNFIFVRILGFLALIVFGYFLGNYIPKIRDKKPGLRIDENGIDDHSDDYSLGLIGWKDIIEIEKKKIATAKYMVIKVNQPEKYIEQAKGRMSRNTLRNRYKVCGSPIAISSNGLRCKFKTLESHLKEAFERYKE